MKRFLFAALMLTAGGGAASAESPFTMTGLGQGAVPIELDVVAGSELTTCKSSRPTWMRCFLFDEENAESIKAAYARQMTDRGWVSVAPRTSSAPGLLVFRPPQSTERCPPVVMILPNPSDTTFAQAPVPAGKAFYTISNALDLGCLLPGGGNKQ
jgi:hypothetical protein